jgi:serine phosphatase RsbU (regulator of sigma subunit)
MRPGDTRVLYTDGVTEAMDTGRVRRSTKDAGA